jgi:hypothetical protein
MSITLREALAKGGVIHLFSKAEAAPVTSSRSAPTTEYWAAPAGSDTEIRLPIDVATLPILAIEAGKLRPLSRFARK